MILGTKKLFGAPVMRFFAKAKFPTPKWLLLEKETMMMIICYTNIQKSQSNLQVQTISNMLTKIKVDTITARIPESHLEQCYAIVWSDLQVVAVQC